MTDEDRAWFDRIHALNKQAIEEAARNRSDYSRFTTDFPWKTFAIAITAVGAWSAVLVFALAHWMRP